MAAAESPLERHLHALASRARSSAENASTPYSGRPEGAAVLLSDGLWVPGVRVESGAFPLTIPALQGAYVGAAAGGRRDIVAAALSRPFDGSEWHWLADALGAAPALLLSDAVAFRDAVPDPAGRLALALDGAPPVTDSAGVELARQAARRAYVPESAFPVGCVLWGEDASGRGVLVPGANVEHADWTRGLCAERTALATAFALGIRHIRKAFLSCPKDPDGTPCGGCRQLLAEYLPEVSLVIDRAERDAEVVTPRALLPSNFSGDTLRA